MLETQTDAFNRRDSRAIDKLWHPDGEFRSSVADIEGSAGVYRAGEVSRYRDDLDELFESWHVESEKFIDVGDHRVVQIQRVTGRGKGSGVPVSRRVGIVYTFRDGLIFRARVFRTPEEALDAVGLSEQHAHADS